MAFSHLDQVGGAIPFANVDAGQTIADGSTVVPSGPHKLGDRAKGHSATYGGGEFILLKGVSSTVVGSVVTFSKSDWTTALVTTTAAKGYSIAFAMSANATASTFGWYQIYGKAQSKKTATAFAGVNDKVYIGVSAGKVTSASAATKAVFGAVAAATAATSASANGPLAVLAISYPHVSQAV
jgi:hypothetical protein